MKKHAFLIMVHRKDEVLETLLKLLDDETDDFLKKLQELETK